MTETYGWVSCKTPPEKEGLYPIIHRSVRKFMEWTGSEWTNYVGEEEPTHYQPRPPDPEVSCTEWSPKTTPVGSAVTYQETQSRYDVRGLIEVIVVDWSSSRVCVRIGEGAWIPLSRGQQARRRIISIELPQKRKQRSEK